MSKKFTTCNGCEREIPFGEMCWMVQDPTDGSTIRLTICQECHGG